MLHCQREIMRKITYLRIFLATGVFTAVAANLTPALAADPTGDWHGAISTPMGDLHVGLSFSRDASGALSGALSSPDQTDQKFPLAGVALSLPYDISEVLSVTPLSLQVEAGIVAVLTLKRRSAAWREVPLPPWLMAELVCRLRVLTQIGAQLLTPRGFSHYARQRSG